MKYIQHMSKNEMLHELARLSAQDRQEIRAKLNELDGLIDGEWTDDNEPSDVEKAMLQRALEEYRRDPKAGSPGEEVMARLRKSPAT